MSHAYSVKQSEEICKTLNVLQLKKVLSDVYLEHLETIVHSVFMLGYKGKVVNTELFSEKHRTTVSHFLNNGKWNSLQFEKALKRQVIDRIYGESQKSREPVFCIVDDTIASHSKPSSQAVYPIEAAYYHQSHLKKRQDYGHPRFLLHRKSSYGIEGFPSNHNCLTSSWICSICISLR